MINFHEGDYRWSTPLQAVKLIGEFTNDSGPFADDWYLCFVVGANGSWYEASMYATGARRALEVLGSRLGEPLEVQLVTSTDCSSRVIWPSRFMNRPLFIFEWPAPTKWWQRALRLARLWPWRKTQRVNKELLSELGPRTG